MNHWTRWTLAAALVLAATVPVSARDWFVSAARGKGKTGTKEKPAKDLGNIVTRLADGDRILIAEGTYLGRGESGHDKIDKAVSIYGGWSDDFTTRDPWGAHKTILSGNNRSDNWANGYRLSVDLSKRRDLRRPHKVVVDGIIVDNAARNRYDAKEIKIIRLANLKTGQNPTPSAGGISVAVTKLGDIVVRDCIVINTASIGGGAISVWGSEKSNVLVQNNLACNNTGYGFFLHTAFHPKEVERMPKFTFDHNTSVFNSKPDPGATHGGAALKLDAATRVTATSNVFALNDFYGVDNAKRSRGVVLNNNLFVTNFRADYLEFDTKMKVADLADEADLLDEAEGNVSTDKLRPPISKEWARKYVARNVVNRAAAEADVKAVKSGVNELRSILGLPLQGTSVGEYSGVWLPRISLDDALRAGGKRVLGKYGSSVPKPVTKTD